MAWAVVDRQEHTVIYQFAFPLSAKGNLEVLLLRLPTIAVIGSVSERRRQRQASLESLASHSSHCRLRYMPFASERSFDVLLIESLA